MTEPIEMLIERLEWAAKALAHVRQVTAAKAIREAAAALSTLTAENEKYREAMDLIEAKIAQARAALNGGE